MIAPAACGAPANGNLFEWGACHGHWHFKKYAAYRLWTPAEFTKFQQLRAAANPNVISDDIIAANNLHPIKGTKRGFCVIDYAPAPEFTQGVRDPRTFMACGVGRNSVLA